MVEASQLFFTHAEVVEALLRRQGIHTGLWSLTVNLRMVANNFVTDATAGPSPGGVVIIENIGIERVQVAVPGLTVDAASLPRQPPLRLVD